MYMDRGMTMSKGSKRVAVCKPRGEASGETKPADIVCFFFSLNFIGV